MQTTTSMAHCDPKQETEYGIAGILHWQQPSGHQAHCLMRLTLKTGAPVVVLAELISSPDEHSVMPETAPSATAAYSVIRDQIPDPTAITWITHLGPFSTPDTLLTPDIEGFSRIHLQWNRSEFEREEIADHENLPLGDPYPLTLALAPVGAVLQQLGWRNWRDEW